MSLQLKLCGETGQVTDMGSKGTLYLGSDTSGAVVMLYSVLRVRYSTHRLLFSQRGLADNLVGTSSRCSRPLPFRLADPLHSSSKLALCLLYLYGILRHQSVLTILCPPAFFLSLSLSSLVPESRASSSASTGQGRKVLKG